MNAELATIDGEIVEQRAPMTLFGTDDPTAVVERASTVATALASVINELNLFSNISGKKHVQVEGWTLLGSMLGVFAEIEWSRPIENGWEARAVARTLAGNVVGAAEAMCTTKERRWGSADTYAVRSMAQTRAVSKALRMPLGFIMHLAGYDATPAEEIPTEQPQGGEREASTGKREQPAKTHPAVSNQYRRGELGELMKAHDLDVTAVEAFSIAVGIPRHERPMSDESMDKLIDAIRESVAIDTSAAARAADQDGTPLPSEELSDAGGVVPSPAGAPPELQERIERARSKAKKAEEPVQEPLLGEPVA